METKLEAVALVLEHGWSPAGEDPDERAVERLERTLVPALAELSPDQREVLLPRMAGGLTAPRWPRSSARPPARSRPCSTEA